MVYWKLKFHDGPWDQREVEIDRDPVKIELSVAARHRTVNNPYAVDLWVYEPVIVEGEVIHMAGKKVGSMVGPTKPGGK